VKILGQELEVERKRLPPMEDRIVSLESDLASQEDAVRLDDVSTVIFLVHVFIITYKGLQKFRVGKYDNVRVALSAKGFVQLWLLHFTRIPRLHV